METKAKVKDSGNTLIIGLILFAVVGAGAWYFTTQTPEAKAKAAAAKAASLLAAGTVPIVPASTLPTLTITNSGESLKKGSKVSFAFANFNPFDAIGVHVEGGGGVTVFSDSTGSGTGGFNDGDPAGIYTMQATDSVGNVAITKFMVT